MPGLGSPLAKDFSNVPWIISTQVCVESEKTASLRMVNNFSNLKCITLVHTSVKHTALKASTSLEVLTPTLIR